MACSVAVAASNAVNSVVLQYAKIVDKRISDLQIVVDSGLRDLRSLVDNSGLWGVALEKKRKIPLAWAVAIS